MKKELVKKSYEMGYKAQKDGKSATPIHNREIMDLLHSTVDIGVGCLPLLKAWAKGWDKANLETEINDILINDPLRILG